MHVCVNNTHFHSTCTCSDWKAYPSIKIPTYQLLNIMNRSMSYPLVQRIRKSTNARIFCAWLLHVFYAISPSVGSIYHCNIVIQITMPVINLNVIISFTRYRETKESLIWYSLWDFDLKEILVFENITNSCYLCDVFCILNAYNDKHGIYTFIR